MGDRTRERLNSELQLVPLKRGDLVDRVNGKIDALYFVNRGLVSIVKTMRDGRTVEIGAVGVEGVTDPNALFELAEPSLELVVQIPGEAFRIRFESLSEAVEADPELRDLMLRYTRFSIGQWAQTAACNRLHSLEERCARWLLIAHDSALSDSFKLTHEFLAMMLGVQRSSVSIAASFLRKAGLIEYTRGIVTIKDRAGLEDLACECHGEMQLALERLFEGHAKHPEPAAARRTSIRA
jgi:CRP-like cAMP-binding protein